VAAGKRADSTAQIYLLLRVKIPPMIVGSGFLFAALFYWAPDQPVESIDCGIVERDGDKINAARRGVGGRSRTDAQKAG